MEKLNHEGGLKGSPSIYKDMTAKEFIKGCEHDGSYIPVGEVIRLMKDFSRLMCAKQKAICYWKLKECGGINENEFDGDKFLNSPYPEELL